jgi:hypothetical protein
MEPSGPQWCKRYPGSTSPDTLLSDFKGRVWAFISAMEKAGATVQVTATFRPPERAYLMHWCWMIARQSLDPDDVPLLAGVSIDWAHDGDSTGARAAARAMVQAFDLQYQPSLTSRHIQRRAIDMTIGWQGTLAIRDFDGNLQHIASTPRTGSNPELVAVGASFGVIKLLSDPPHWSDDGH